MASCCGQLLTSCTAHWNGFRTRLPSLDEHLSEDVDCLSFQLSASLRCALTCVGCRTHGSACHENKQNSVCWLSHPVNSWSEIGMVSSRKTNLGAPFQQHMSYCSPLTGIANADTRASRACRCRTSCWPLTAKHVSVSCSTRTALVHCNLAHHSELRAHCFQSTHRDLDPASVTVVPDVII